MTKKTYIILGLGLLGLTLAAPARAILPPLDNYQYEIPKDHDALPDSFRVWSKPKVSAWSKNSTCQLMSSKAGIVAAMTVAGQTGDHVALFDASAVGTLSAASPDTTKLIAMVSADTGKEPSTKEFRTPIPFLNGLVLCPSSATSEGAVERYEQK